jgi:hypothetical protein
MNILIKVFKIPFNVVNLLFVEVIDFFLLSILDLFNISKGFFKPTKE